MEDSISLEIKTDSVNVYLPDLGIKELEKEISPRSKLSDIQVLNSTDAKFESLKSEVSRGFIDTTIVFSILLGVSSSFVASEMHFWLLKLLKRNPGVERLDVVFNGQRISIEKGEILTPDVLQKKLEVATNQDVRH